MDEQVASAGAPSPIEVKLERYTSNRTRPTVPWRPSRATNLKANYLFFSRSHVRNSISYRMEYCEMLRKNAELLSARAHRERSFHRRQALMQRYVEKYRRRAENAEALTEIKSEFVRNPRFKPGSVEPLPMTTIIEEYHAKFPSSSRQNPIRKAKSLEDKTAALQLVVGRLHQMSLENPKAVENTISDETIKKFTNIKL